MQNSDGFPWTKLHDAQKFLYAIKPWWNRFGEKMTYIPIDVPAPPGERYGGITHTDRDMNVYIDKSFALNASLEELAGSLEHELQYHVRDAWNRLNWLSEEDRKKYRNVCMEMEICSSINAESYVLDEKIIDRILTSSLVFTSRMAAKWEVKGAPSILEKAWTPDKLGLPPSLSAEEYYRLLKQDEEKPPPSDQSVSDGDEEQEEESPEEGNEPQQSEEGGDEGSGDSPDQNGPSESASGESPEDTESDDKPDDSEQAEDEANSESSEDDLDETQEDDNQEEFSGESDTESEPSEEQGDEQESSDDNPNEPGDDSDSENEQEDGEPSSDQEEEQDSSEEEDESSSGSSGESSAQESSSEESGEPSPSQKMQEIKRSDPNLSWWANDKEQFTENVDEEKQEVSNFEMSEAYKELAEDVKEGGRNRTVGHGMKPGNSMMDWAYDEERGNGSDTWSIINQLISRKCTSVKVRGASDLSFSVRNPNQQQIGPVLMGLTGYAPKVYMLIDVSGSMTSFMQTNVDNFKSIMNSVKMRFGSEVTWITADSGIYDLGTERSFSASKLMPSMKFGFGGSFGFSEVMNQLAEGHVRWKGRRYDKPDLLVVTTDGFFPWPWINTLRPPRNTEILILSVAPLDVISERYELPEWIEEGRNFVYIEE